MIGHNKVRERASNPETLSALLADLEDLERQISQAPSVPLSRVPGRKPSSSRMATDEEDREQLSSLQHERDELLQRMARESIPHGRWVRHGREILYLQASPDRARGGAICEMYRLPASYGRWVPRQAEEAPWVTERRAEYGRWYRRVIAVAIAATLTIGVFAVSALLLWSWPVSMVLLFLAFLCWAGTSAYTFGSLGLGPILEDGGPHAPFEQIAPGTGEASARLAAGRERRKAREYDKRLSSIAPRPQAPREKTHDYTYEYAGFHPDAESSCRVRIYQDAADGRDAPVIVLTQELPPAGTSLTNLIEAVSAEVILSELPHLLPRSRRAARRARRKPPFHVVQYDFGEKSKNWLGDRGDGTGESICIVTFADYRVQAPMELPRVEHGEISGEEVTVVRGNHTERPRFGVPYWHHEGREVAERVVGTEL